MDTPSGMNKSMLLSRLNKLFQDPKLLSNMQDSFVAQFLTEVNPFKPILDPPSNL